MTLQPENSLLLHMQILLYLLPDGSRAKLYLLSFRVLWAQVEISDFAQIMCFRLNWPIR